MPGAIWHAIRLIRTEAFRGIPASLSFILRYVRHGCHLVDASTRRHPVRCGRRSEPFHLRERRLAQLQDQGKLLDQHASLAKAFCTTRMRETVAWAREIFGGNGIVLDYNVARFFADSEALHSYEGTREMNSLIVGKAVSGFSAFA